MLACLCLAGWAATAEEERGGCSWLARRLSRSREQSSRHLSDNKHNTKQCDENKNNSVLFGAQARFFDDEIKPNLKHNRRGLVGMASGGKDLNASQFYITLGAECPSLDEKRTIFGAVGEGLEVLDAINEAFVDDAGRPYQNIR